MYTRLWMDSLEALRTIKRLFAEGRYDVTDHFLLEMRNDVFFFVDIETAIREAGSATEKGADGAGNPKWEIEGPTVAPWASCVPCAWRKTC